MRKLIALSAAVALYALPTAATAQLTVTGNVSATPVIASVGTTAIAATFNGAPGSTMVGPFQMTFGGIFGSAIHDIVCVDLNNTFYNGQSYSANLTLLSSTDGALTTRTRQGMYYGNDFTSHYVYLKMAWLAEHLYTQPNAEWSGIQGAIWHISTGWNPFGGDTNPNVQHWLDLVYAADLSTVNQNSWAVVTDVNVTGAEGGVQEFLVRTNVVPEPSTYLMLATGLLGVALIARRRRMA
jgi:PEP-CTERM motif/Thioester domain